MKRLLTLCALALALTGCELASASESYPCPEYGASAVCLTIEESDGIADWRLPTIPLFKCLDIMETAMRAREEWATLTDERDRLVTVTNGTTYSNLIVEPSTLEVHPYMPMSDGDYSAYVPDRRTEEERLVDEQKALDEKKIALSKRRDRERVEAEKKQERMGKLAVLKAQWELGKACWVQK